MPPETTPDQDAAATRAWYMLPQKRIMDPWAITIPIEIFPDAAEWAAVRTDLTRRTTYEQWCRKRAWIVDSLKWRGLRSSDVMVYAEIFHSWCRRCDVPPCRLVLAEFVLAGGGMQPPKLGFHRLTLESVERVRARLASRSPHPADPTPTP